MQRHHRSRGGKGGRVSVHRHGQAVADKYAVDIRVGFGMATRVVIAGDHRDLAALVFHLLKIVDVHSRALGNACSMSLQPRRRNENRKFAGIVGSTRLTAGKSADVYYFGGPSKA